MYVYNSLCIHSFIDGQLAYFHLSATVNSTVMNIYIII